MKKNYKQKLRKGQKCPATINVGPGHQSKLHCAVTGPHEQHSDIGGYYYWTKKHAFSGFFDESPEESR